MKNSSTITFRLVLITIILMCSTLVLNAQIVNIPDVYFKAALVGNNAINTNLDAEIQVSEAASFNGIIDVSNLGISDLTGIEAFPLITDLNCSFNSISDIDISNNLSLINFVCANNQIDHLDLSNNTNLNLINCASNQLSFLNLELNTQLFNIRCDDNPIHNLDLSSNLLINAMYCNNLNLFYLDLSNLTSLTYFECTNNNEITVINMQNGNNANLLLFSCVSCPTLVCVQVDNTTFMNNNWGGAIDGISSYSTSCSCTVNIPDANFKAALVANLAINTNADGEIQCSEASVYSGAINVDNLGITDLTGIGTFSQIDTLICTNNLLTSIDVSSNPQLTYLCFSNNQLTTIDVSLNTLLVEICGQFNQLTSIDVSTNTALKYLYLSSNQLTSLDVSNNDALWYLACSINNISSLDVTNCPELFEINCSNNQISNLDFSNNTDMYYVYCDNNLLTNIDLSLDTSLVILNCNNNNLNYLNLQNGNNLDLTTFNATNNPNLTCVQVDDATFMSNNWAAAIDATATYNTFCGCNVNIPDANFKAALVADLAINTNADTEIQCSEAIAYTGTINVDGLGINDLTGIEAFGNITQLFCSNNNLTSLNINSNTLITSFACEVNQITAIDLSSNTLLTTIGVTNNQLTSIDLSNNSQLVNFYCTFNSITSLDFSANPLLELIVAGANPVSSINLTNNPVLKNLTVGEELTSLDLSNLPLLENINSGGSPLLTSLDFSNNPNLMTIECANNGLTSLDISGNPNVTSIQVPNNNFSSLNLQNGNNTNFTNVNLLNNPSLNCIQVDDPAFMISNWMGGKDPGAVYSSNCLSCGVLPTPQFSVNTNNITTAPANAIFTNTTANAGLYDFTWQFGDGSAINNDNSTVNYTYNNNGTFNVSLTLTETTTGCTSTNYDPTNAAQTVVCNVPTGNVCGYTPTISPNGLINACIGSEVILTINPGSYPIGSLIQWNKNGLTIIGENFPEYYVTEDGYYSVTVFSALGCPVVSDPVQVQFTLPAMTVPTISQTGTSGPCGQTNVTLTANGSFGSYLWNNGLTGNSISVTQAGNYSVIGQGGVGCSYSSNSYPVSTSSFASPEICMVDVDSLTNHSVIIWEKPIMTGILGFGIYKETSLYSENYQQIAIVPYDSLSEYIDVNSDASIIADRYLLTIIDSCGGESAASAPARAMGLKVYPGINNQRVLSWNYYVSSAQNFVEYNIYSGSNINSLNYLTTVPASINSNYIDANPAFGINTIYRVTANMIIPCESTRAARTRSISNGNGNFTTPYTVTTLEENINSNSIDMAIVPNPTNGIFKLRFANQSIKNQGHFYVFDFLGNIVFEQEINKTNQIEVDLTSLSNGVYNAKFVSGQKEVNKKLVITQ